MQRAFSRLALLWGIAAVGALYLWVSDFSIERDILTDWHYAPTFTFDDFALRIPNRSLAYPWPSGQQPPSTLCAISSSYRSASPQLCGVLADSGSVVILLPLQTRNSSGQSIKWLSSVDFSYNSRIKFPNDLAAHFPQNYVGFFPVGRVAGLDLPGFKAWELVVDDEGMERVRWLRNIAEDILVRNTASEPQQIVCERKKTDNDLHRSRCHASMGFMTNKYPKRDGLFYPYSVEFTLPGAAVGSSLSLADVVQAGLEKFMVDANGLPILRGQADRP